MRETALSDEWSRVAYSPWLHEYRISRWNYTPCGLAIHNDMGFIYMKKLYVPGHVCDHLSLTNFLSRYVLNVLYSCWWFGPISARYFTYTQESVSTLWLQEHLSHFEFCLVTLSERYSTYFVCSRMHNNRVFQTLQIYPNFRVIAHIVYDTFTDTRRVHVSPYFFSLSLILYS